MSPPKPLKCDLRAAASPRRDSPPARVAGLIGTIVIAGLLPCSAARGQPADAEILSVLADMVGQKYQFKPDRLHAMGVEGLVAVLDELLPDTAEPKKVEASKQTIARSIERLGDESFRVRETASRSLDELGAGIRAVLVEAAHNADAEVSWRATRILRRWERKQKEDKGRYYPAFCVYATGIRDEGRLRELVRRTTMALQAGLPTGSRRNILRQCMTTIAASGEEEYTNRLKPFLEHADVRVAVLVTQAIGAAVSSGRCPALFLDALKADRDEVVAAAIVYTQNCADGVHKPEIKRRLIEIFEGGNEAQRFRTTIPLMDAFGYTEARDYLLKQAGSGDRSRQYQALNYLGSSRNRGKAADKKLLDALKPLLSSTDHSLRRYAARALGNYRGEEVVKSLIPLLADRYAGSEVSRKLLEQPDKKMVRRLLSAAEQDDSDEKAKKVAAELLKRLGPQQ